MKKPPVCSLIGVVVALSVAALAVTGLSSPQINDADLPVPIVDPEQIPFTESSFTFARIMYSNSPGRFPAATAWATDFPEADFHFTALFEQTTGLPSNEPVTLELTDPGLPRYPFIYMVEGGNMTLSEDEAASLRDYLLGGGFLMVDDFWGDREWESLAGELRRVFPDREAVDLQVDHEIFSSFYQIDDMPMLPNIGTLAAGERTGEQGATQAYYRGLFDDTGWLMAVLCQNTDFGDAWEHSENPAYPREVFLEEALPMSVNIAVYALSR
jgi:hypothetical protein